MSLAFDKDLSSGFIVAGLEKAESGGEPVVEMTQVTTGLGECAKDYLRAPHLEGVVAWHASSHDLPGLDETVSPCGPGAVFELSSHLPTSKGEFLSEGGNVLERRLFAWECVGHRKTALTSSVRPSLPRTTTCSTLSTASMRGMSLSSSRLRPSTWRLRWVSIDSSTASAQAVPLTARISVASCRIAAACLWARCLRSR